MQGTPQLRYSADYDVVKEQNIAEKISFLNENLPQSSCVKVRDELLHLITSLCYKNQNSHQKLKDE